MSTTLKELRRQVLLRVKNPDGMTELIVDQAINDAQRLIAMTNDFDELLTLSTTNATVADQRDYVIGTHWTFTRLKTIYNIRYMDEGDSRKLTYVPFLELDEKVPYPEQVGTGRPYWYTQRGTTIQLFRIPDAAKYLYIQHSQWPVVLDSDDDETSYENIDLPIVALATDLATAMLEKTTDKVDWMKRAQIALGLMMQQENRQPDRTFVAKPFDPYGYPVVGEYWKDPFIKHNP